MPVTIPNHVVAYCKECDRYFDARVGCPCDVAFTLRTTLESRGVDCNAALLAQETLLSLAGVQLPNVVPHTVPTSIFSTPANPTTPALNAPLDESTLSAIDRAWKETWPFIADTRE